MKKMIFIIMLVFPSIVNAQQTYTKEEHRQQFANLFFEMIELERGRVLYEGFGANNPKAADWLERAKEFDNTKITGENAPFATCYFVPNYAEDSFVCPSEMIQLAQSFWRKILGIFPLHIYQRPMQWNLAIAQINTAP